MSANKSSNSNNRVVFIVVIIVALIIGNYLTKNTNVMKAIGATSSEIDKGIDKTIDIVNADQFDSLPDSSISNSKINTSNSRTQEYLEKIKEYKKNGKINLRSIGKPKSKSNEEQYHKWIVEACNKYGISPNLGRGLVQQESQFNSRNKSPVGAMGLTQLMPDTAKLLKVDPWDARQNIFGGMRYLKDRLVKFKGNVDLSLAAYNAGDGRIKNGKIPNIEETMIYVWCVVKYKEGYDILYPADR